MKTRHYIISGISAYLFFLIITVPAAPVLALLQSYLPSVSIQGVSGGLWNGNAAAITINRQHTLNNTDWQLNGWRLFSGELSAQINTQYQQQPISGLVGVRPSGTITARDVSASMDAATLAQLAQLPIAELSGKVALQIAQLEWQQHKIPRLTGVVHWNRATVTVAETAELGDLVIDITENTTQPLHASIRNRGGQIKLEGEANVGEDGAYSLQLNMLPNQNASSNIRSSLGLIGKAQQNGSYQLDNNGNLKQFGLI